MDPSYEGPGIPESVVSAAAKQDCLRLGSYRTAWLAHHCNGAVTHVEIRSRTYKGSLRGGVKTLFRFGPVDGGFTRAAVFEAPIDALSLAAIEQVRPDTIYVATGGGMGPGTLAGLQ